MKHVLVETSFIIEAARPFPGPEAEALLARQDLGEIRLHVPWCSVAEARRTLSRIIDDDLGFAGAMLKLASRLYQAGDRTFDKGEVDKLAMLAKATRTEAMRSKNARVDALAARMDVIVPSESVVSTTLRLFDARQLKPFDEMALGAILTRAGELHAAGQRELYFCSLDRGDFGPSPSRPNLQAAYAACGLQFRATLHI